MVTKNKLTLALVIAALTASQTLTAGDLERRQAKRIHDRLTGVNPSTATIDAMEATLDCTLPATPGYPCDGTGENAARYAIDTLQHNVNAGNPDARSFYNVTVKNFATPWTNEAQSVFEPLNDYSATVVGAVRDGIDFRRILHDDLVYVGNNAPAYNMSDNLHYEALEDLDPNGAGNLSDPLVLTASQQSVVTAGAIPTNAAAGVMTSRAGAMAFYSDGTNRAMFRFTLMNHLCTDLEPLKDISRNPSRVRRDVSRSPGGDSRIFLNSCVGCHAGMDGMAGAFAFYEWDYNNVKEDGRLVYRDLANPKFDPITGVSLKHNINETNFEPGYVTEDQNWINYWRNGQNALLGWGTATDPDEDGNERGSGARELGQELANSDAFAQCQVDKVFEAICLRGPNEFIGGSIQDRAARDAIVASFKDAGIYNYNLREVFIDVAAHCKGN